MIRLVPVSQKDVRFLWNGLKERTAEMVISFKMPTWKNHCDFVAKGGGAHGHPYKHWFIIQAGRKKVGNIYLTCDNEIGIFIARQHAAKGYGSEALANLIRLTKESFYLANISPRNAVSIKFFESRGFDLLQHTYKLNTSLRKEEM